MRPITYMIFSLLLITGILYSCQQQVAEEQVASSSEDSTASAQESKEPDMYEASELAALMRNMYDRNLELGKQINEGNLPESFPEDFYTIHTAEATPGMVHDTAFFKTMSEQYLLNMNKITEAENQREAKIAYNDMIMTCAGCHQVYCQGPLPTIRKMKLSLNEETPGNN